MAKPDPPYTSKQMGDACEMLIAAELTLAGIPAIKAPDNWPHYDVIAQRKDDEIPLRISVKSRTYKTATQTAVDASTSSRAKLPILQLGETRLRARVRMDATGESTKSKISSRCFGIISRSGLSDRPRRQRFGWLER